MHWDDLRYVLALVQAGSLSRAAKALQVDHTTVARRIAALESDLGVTLFARTTTGLVPTAEAERLLPEIRDVERAVLALARRVHAQHDGLAGVVRVTSGETFGICYLAPRLARLGLLHPGLTLELVTGAAVLDLARREADIAVRFFRSEQENLVVRRVAELRHGLYASHALLAHNPVQPDDLHGQRILTATAGPGVVEAAWVERVTQGTPPAFVSNMTLALVEAARAGAGLAVLPRYLGDADPQLQRLARNDEPTESVWLTVHEDLQRTPRVRVVLDFLADQLRADAKLLRGN